MAGLNRMDIAVKAREDNSRLSKISITQAYHLKKQVESAVSRGYTTDQINEALTKQKGIHLEDLDTKLSDYSGNFAQGATLGFSDEGYGALQAIGNLLKGDTNISKNYTDARDESRSDVSSVQQEHPTGAFLAQMAGGILPALTGAGLAGEGATLGGTMLRQGLGGAALGGAESIGKDTSGDLNQMLKDTAQGGMTGFVAGSAGSMLGSGLSSIVNTFRSPLSKAAQALAKTNVNPDDVIQALGRGQLPVDVSEEAASFTQQNLARTGDVAKAREPIVNRDPTSAVYNELHNSRYPNEPIQTPDDYKKFADTTFASAKNDIVPMDPEISRFLKIPMVKKAYDAARKTYDVADLNLMNKNKAVPVELLEMTRQNIKGFAPDSMASKATQLSQELVKKAGSTQWEEALAASQRHLQASDMFDNAPKLLDSKMPSTEFVSLAHELVDQPINGVAPDVLSRIRDHAYVQRSIDAGNSANASSVTADATREPFSSVVSNAAQAGVMASNHPVIAANKAVQAVRGLMPSHSQISKEIAHLMANKDPKIWQEISKNLPSFVNTKTAGRIIGGGLLDTLNDGLR